MTVTVDVLSVGSGSGVLGAAVSAARAGMSVMYTDLFSARPHAGQTAALPLSWSGVLLQRWGVQTLDRHTHAYLDEVTADIGDPDLTAELEGVTVTELRPGLRREDGSVAPFRGAQLRNWSRQCLTATTGVISTRVTLPGAVKIRSASGEAIEVSDIVAMPEEGIGEVDLHSWLLGRAREYGVQIVTGQGLHRLLFADDQVFGGIIDTPSGSQVVRSRHGVLLGTGIRDHRLPRPALPCARTRLCLSSRNASRFARLELVPDQELPSRRPSTSLGRRGGGTVSSGQAHARRPILRSGRGKRSRA